MKPIWLYLALIVLPARAVAAEFDATLGWGEMARLGFPVSGVVVEVAVAAGQNVTKGQLLARLDARRFDIARARAQARVDGLQPSVDEARREAERAQSLYDRAVSSDRELQVALIAEAEAEARLGEAEAELADAKLDAEYSRLRAPFAGRVLRTDVVVGESINSSEQVRDVVHLAASNTAVMTIATSQAGGLLKAQQLTFKINGTDHSAIIKSVSFRDNDVKLVIALEQPFDAAWLGQSVRVRTGD